MAIDALLLRRAVVSASAAVYWIGVAVHARNIRKRIGRAPNLKPRTPKEKMLWRGWAAANLGCLLQPLVIPGKFAFAPLLAAWTFGAGAGLVVLGYLATLWCYASMGDTWRIGVDRGEKTALITRGPYRFVRHPIYAFQVVMLLGCALLLPTMVSLLILALHFACVQIKAADEENYLRGVHGTAYADYMKRTGRLLPKLTKRQVARRD